MEIVNATAVFRYRVVASSISNEYMAMGMTIAVLVLNTVGFTNPGPLNLYSGPFGGSPETPGNVEGLRDTPPIMDVSDVVVFGTKHNVPDAR